MVKNMFISDFFWLFYLLHSPPNTSFQSSPNTSTPIFLVSRSENHINKCSKHKEISSASRNWSYTIPLAVFVLSPAFHAAIPGSSPGILDIFNVSFKLQWFSSRCHLVITPSWLHGSWLDAAIRRDAGAGTQSQTSVSRYAWVKSQIPLHCICYEGICTIQMGEVKTSRPFDVSRWL